MLVHSRTGKWATWAVFLLLFVPLFALPLLVIVAASFTTNWSGAFPRARPPSTTGQPPAVIPSKPSPPA